MNLVRGVPDIKRSFRDAFEHKRKALGMFTQKKAEFSKKTVKDSCLSKKLNANKKILFLFLFWLGKSKVS
jgi:hypothetical protein